MLLDNVDSALRAIGSPESELRESARETLKERGASWIPAIQKRLNDPSADIRRGAVSALADLRHKGAILGIISALSDADTWVRYEACWACESFSDEASDALPNLIALLNDPSWNVRQAAIEAAAQIGRYDEKIMAAIGAKLQDVDLNVRASAADALSRFGSLSSEVRRQLISRLHDPDSFVRRSAATSIARLHFQLEDELLSSLVDLLADENYGVRKAAAIALRQYGPNATVALPRLIDNLSLAESSLQSEMRKTIVEIGPLSIEPLIIALSKSLGVGRVQIIQTLGELGCQHHSAVNLLGQCLNDEDEMVRLRSAESLWKLAGDINLDVFIRSLKSVNQDVIVAAAKCLSRFGAVAANAEIELCAVVQEGSSSVVRSEAAIALAKIGARSTTTIQRLIGMLEDSDYDAVIVAARALGIIGPAAKNALPFLVRHLDGADDEMRATIIRVVGRISVQVELPDGLLTGLLNDPNEDIRLVVKKSLERISKRSIK